MRYINRRFACLFSWAYLGTILSSKLALWHTGDRASYPGIKQGVSAVQTIWKPLS